MMKEVVSHDFYARYSDRDRILWALNAILVAPLTNVLVKRSWPSPLMRVSRGNGVGGEVPELKAW